ncbi:MAG: hypothetical protein Q9217_001555 [Psora testacea]
MYSRRKVIQPILMQSLNEFPFDSISEPPHRLGTKQRIFANANPSPWTLYERSEPQG